MGGETFHFFPRRPEKYRREGTAISLYSLYSLYFAVFAVATGMAFLGSPMEKMKGFCHH
jgi:hypothetical protein